MANEPQNGDFASLVEKEQHDTTAYRSKEVADARFEADRAIWLQQRELEKELEGKTQSANLKPTTKRLLKNIAILVFIALYVCLILNYESVIFFFAGLLEKIILKSYV